jgi:hypothetical protein
MLLHLFHQNLKYDPTNRIDSQNLLEKLSSEEQNKIEFHTLEVSQATALEKSDKEIAEGSANVSLHHTQVPKNDGTNACAFLSLGIIDSLVNEENVASIEEIISITESMISEFPTKFNEHRDVSKMVDIYEAYDILEKQDLLMHSL